MKKIYLLLSRTNTLPSRAIHSILGGRFTHVSIATRPSTNEFYSFARRTLYNPFNAGFIVEDVHKHVFSRYPDCKCAVYSLEVADEAYEKINKALNYFKENIEAFNYNFLGLLPAKLGIKLHRKHHFTCSQFVATLLKYSEAVKLPKECSLMMPNDFLDIPQLELIYNGRIADCKIPLSNRFKTLKPKRLAKNI